MKKAILMLCLVLFTSFAQAQLRGDTWAEAEQNGQATIAISYVLTPAFVYQDEEGNLTGICVDIMESFVRFVQRQYGVTVTVEYEEEGLSFRESYDRVKASSGGVFGLGNITITEARKEEIQFTPPIITNIAVLVTQNHVDDLSSMNAISSEFVNMHAYVSRGTLQDTRIQNLKETFFETLEIRYTDSSGEALDRVLEDPMGFSYQDIALFWDRKQQGHPIKRHPVADELSEHFGIIMPLDCDWAPIFERFFTLGADIDQHQNIAGFSFSILDRK